MTRVGLLSILLFAGCMSTNGAARPPSGEAPSAARQQGQITEQYRSVVDRIVAAALADPGAYEKLEYLTDRIGNRLSGSPALEEAVKWAASAMSADGHENVHTEPVKVPHWVRGEARAAITRPIQRSISLLALGGSVGTREGGIRAPLVVVSSYEELERLEQGAVRGKIVLYNNPMPHYGPKGSGYGETVVFRSTGAIRAAKLGAIGVLIRSVTATSLRTPHTGAMRYDDNVEKIPAAAVSTEDADLLARLTKSASPVELEMMLGSRTLPDAESANVIGELRGREHPDEVVVIGGHIDSWDVGQGAHDDGAGVVMSMQALTTLRKLELRPRRTIRVVLFTNEENGLGGAREYARAHKEEISRHVAAIEADSGAFKPLGFRIETREPEASPEPRPPASRKPRASDPPPYADPVALARATEICALLSGVPATFVAAGHSGADISTLKAPGVSLLGLEVEGSKYFDYHHSDADTLDKVDPLDLRKDVAAMAAMAYVIADLEPRLSSAGGPDGAKSAGVSAQ